MARAELLAFAAHNVPAATPLNFIELNAQDKMRAGRSPAGIQLSMGRAGLELCLCHTFTLPDPVLHGTMDCYSGKHLVTKCPFLLQLSMRLIWFGDYVVQLLTVEYYAFCCTACRC
jgi:hypothetical protein